MAFFEDQSRSATNLNLHSDDPQGDDEMDEASPWEETPIPPISISFNNMSSPSRSPTSKPSKPEAHLFSFDAGPLTASADARRIVRLIQCPVCSYPIQEPVALPCGNSLCKKCVPELHIRQNISYPAEPGRRNGFTCPFSNCRTDHSVGDCSLDVVFKKILNVIKKDMEARNRSDSSTVMLQVEEKDGWVVAGVPSLRKKPSQLFLPGGRLVATYTMAAKGLLPYDSEVSYSPMSPTGASIGALDESVLAHLKELARSEMDCQVCYGLFLDPFTTTCGHTFCRNCLHRVLDHSRLCPVCRRHQTLSSGTIHARKPPVNQSLARLLGSLCSEALAKRKAIAEEEEKPGTPECDMPLFVCALSFPKVPTFLHVFEPRYRLMIRRAMESGDRKFGMVLFNKHKIPQGDLGPVHFFEYGTILHIVNIQVMVDGRSIMETRGGSRFRVMKHGTKDGYTMGAIELIDDIPIADEEAYEAAETSSRFSSPGLPTPAQTPEPDDLSSIPTQDLYDICIKFMRRMRDRSEPWLHAQVFRAFGDIPEDPAVLPWWLGSVLPLTETEKYKLLPTESVRQRLKICVGWIRGIERDIETRNRSESNSCSIL